MAKRKAIDDLIRRRVVAAIAESSEHGCPVAGRTTAQQEETAAIALRRWQSLSRRRVRSNDLEAQIRDIARGLVQAFEKDRRLVGPLIVDYQYLASKIVEAIQSAGDQAGPRP